MLNLGKEFNFLYEILSKLGFKNKNDKEARKVCRRSYWTLQMLDQELNFS